MTTSNTEFSFKTDTKSPKKRSWKRFWITLVIIAVSATVFLIYLSKKTDTSSTRQQAEKMMKQHEGNKKEIAKRRKKLEAELAQWRQDSIDREFYCQADEGLMADSAESKELDALEDGLKQRKESPVCTKISSSASLSVTISDD